MTHDTVYVAKAIYESGEATIFHTDLECRQISTADVLELDSLRTTGMRECADCAAAGERVPTRRPHTLAATLEGLEPDDIGGGSA